MGCIARAVLVGSGKELCGHCRSSDDRKIAHVMAAKRSRFLREKAELVVLVVMTTGYSELSLVKSQASWSLKSSIQIGRLL